LSRNNVFDDLAYLKGLILAHQNFRNESLDNSSVQKFLNDLKKDKYHVNIMDSKSAKGLLSSPHFNEAQVKELLNIYFDKLKDLNKKTETQVELFQFSSEKIMMNTSRNLKN
jgi:hypothetical protein